VKNEFDEKDVDDSPAYNKKADKTVAKMLSESIEKGYCIYCGAVINLFTCGWDDGDPKCLGGCFHG